MNAMTALWVALAIVVGLPLLVIALCTVVLLWMMAIDMVKELLGVY